MRRWLWWAALSPLCPRGEEQSLDHPTRGRSPWIQRRVPGVGARIRTGIGDTGIDTSPDRDWGVAPMKVPPIPDYPTGLFQFLVPLARLSRSVIGRTMARFPRDRSTASSLDAGVYS
jgi:hypothetical protein